MSLSNLNATTELQVLEVFLKSTTSSVIPLLLLESVIMGVLCAIVPLGSYMLWIRSVAVPRGPSISMLWLILASLITHWALSLRQIESTLSGRTLGLSRTFYGFIDAVSVEQGDPDFVQSYYDYASDFQYLLPLVTESVLFGFGSFLFAVTAYTSFRQVHLQSSSVFTLAIPALASLMYLLSLSHWAVSIRCFTWVASVSARTGDSWPTSIDTLGVVLLAILSFNAVLSDSIVLWRMSIVWERSRPVVILAAALITTTLGLNITNLIRNSRNRDVVYNGQIYDNVHDTEVVSTYGGDSVGLAAAFLSLASNLCATILVGVRVWLHKRRNSKHLHSDNRRTLVERFLVLLTDSGVVYTVLWILYCISFFHPITSQVVLGAKSQDKFPLVTASGYLDAAMAQLTSIYPFAVFILVALDKVHHSRVVRPQILRNNDWPKERTPAVTVTLEVEIERGSTLGHTVALPDTGSSTTAVESDTKVASAETP
ncbi:unnamed protein product [Peniophora sp. CBMAI 1063]|nr:unnamed protein product [Peniophora sp. CBMAI 1063]